MKQIGIWMCAIICATVGPALGEDFNVIAYTGHYNAEYPQGTIEDLQHIPAGPNGWPRLLTEPTAGQAQEIELFLFISTDRDSGVGGIDFTDPITTDEFGDPRPSGIFSGDRDAPDPHARIQNRAYRDPVPPPPPAPEEFVPVHDELNAVAWDGFYEYEAAPDTWFHMPFIHFDFAYVQEDPSPAPGNRYLGDFYKAAALQYELNVGWEDPTLGGNGQLVPYTHLVVSVRGLTLDQTSWVSIGGVPVLTDLNRPQDYNWLGMHIDDTGAHFAPYGRIEFAIPEPATVLLMACIAGMASARRRN